MHVFKSLILATAISAALLGAAGDAYAADQARGTFKFLSGPQSGAQDAIALGYLANQRANLGLTVADISDMAVRDDYQTKHNGIRHMYWRQTHEGIEVWNGDLAINVAHDGSVINLHNNFVPDLAGKAQRTTPEIDAIAAINSAAQELGLSVRFPLQLLRASGGPARIATYSGAGLSADEIPVRLVYQPDRDNNTVRLAWDLTIRETTGANWWSMRVDAATGEVIGKNNFVAHSGAQPAQVQGGGTHAYMVFPFPFENPNETAQGMVTDPANALASPFGWHDNNGAAGDEFTDTRGNNVLAQEDKDGNNTGGTRPSGTGSSPLTFNFAFNPGDEPNAGTNESAAIVNLFYWNNIMHDMTYQYGFDEAGGNFQTNTYGRGGAGNDQVSAEALDNLNGGSRGNANFGTPGDGAPPRMQMFLWHAPIEVVVNSPGGIAGTYASVLAGFGPALGGVGVTGNLQLVDDGVVGVPVPPATVPGTLNDGCEIAGMPPGSLTGKIAVIDRGFCSFNLKTFNAQSAGAVATIIVNNVAGPAVGMAPATPPIAVSTPAMMVSQADGATMKGQLPSPGVNATVRATQVNRDSDMDAGIIAHEYGHGISNRLTGGPANPSCLISEPGGAGTGFSEQAGEGWSDFWALVIHAKPTDTALTPRFIGTYPSFQTNAAGPGIRNFPYSTNPAVSPQTYANVATTNAPHGVGEIWAGALWNLYWELVGDYGYDANLYTGTGGNNLTIQLVVDGMKLQPCSPTMVQARDAIFAADAANNASANTCAIWRAFAAKGLGVNAIDGTGTQANRFLRGNETADATIPLACEAFFVFSDGFE